MKSKKNKKSALAALLPKESTKKSFDPASLCFLIIGPPKWGKTEFFMSNPDAVLLATEEGHKFQAGHKMIIDRWDATKHDNYKNWTDDEGCPHMTFMQAVEVLEAFNKFNMVIIDTVEMGCNMCVDFHVEQDPQAKHLEDLGSYGKGYDLGLNVPFRQAIMRILKTGRGVVLICHTKLEIARFTSGEKARKEARLPKTIKALVEGQADVIVHCEMGKKRNGERHRDRILVCEGDADTLAGNRTGMLPDRYIVKRPNQWAQFCKFFTVPGYAEKQERIYRKHYKKSSSDDSE